MLDEIQETDGSWVGSLSTGNAGLKPYESTNVDLSFEFYMPSGLISVAPFYKRIDNPIYDRSTVEQNVVRNGRTFARFGFARPENAEHGHIAGIEFAYQNVFTRLPSPFDGLGANINYTWTDSSVTVFGRTEDDLPFFQQSNHVGNLAVLYRKYGVEAQLAVSFQGPALGSIGADAASDNYSDFYMPVDAKVSVPVSRRFRAFLELRNLTDEARRRFAGVSDRRVHHEIYARDIYAGSGLEMAVIVRRVVRRSLLAILLPDALSSQARAARVVTSFSFRSTASQRSISTTRRSICRTSAPLLPRERARRRASRCSPA